MIDPNDIYFLLLVALGAAIQTISGFAMALIIIGGVTALGIAEVALAAAVVSIVSLVNTTVALRGCYRSIESQYVMWISLGMLPMTLVGILVLDYLAATASDFLRLLLGFVIILAGGLLMLKPALHELRSSNLVMVLTGMAGGLMGGMYGAGGAPYAYLMYRQPLGLIAVRATLLAIFTVSTLGRTLMVAFDGHLNQEVLSLSALSIPLVIIVTLTISRFSHKISDALVRKIAFGLLILLGSYLIVS